MTVAIYLAHLNPVTNAHLQIIEELKKNYDVIVMPVIFKKNKEELNSRSFPFNFEIRKKMLISVFGESVSISSNYTFFAPFYKYLPPLLSKKSWELRKQILQEISGNYVTYTGDKAEGYMLKLYNLNPIVGKRKEVSAADVKNQLYDEANRKKTNWAQNVPLSVEKIIKENWSVVEKYSNREDYTIRVLGMKFPKEGFWST